MPTPSLGTEVAEPDFTLDAGWAHITPPAGETWLMVLLGGPPAFELSVDMAFYLHPDDITPPDLDAPQVEWEFFRHVPDPFSSSPPDQSVWVGWQRGGTGELWVRSSVALINLDMYLVLVDDAVSVTYAELSQDLLQFDPIVCPELEYASDLNLIVRVAASVERVGTDTADVTQTGTDDDFGVADLDDVTYAIQDDDGPAYGLTLVFSGEPAPITINAELDSLAPFTLDISPPDTLEVLLDAAATFELDTVVPSLRTDWWAELVDADGNLLARMPDAVIGDIVETLNDVTTTTVTVLITSAAGQLLDAAVVPPDIEVMVWRGDVLWLWGPVTGLPRVNGSSVTVPVADAAWHLGRRHVGKLGQDYGGVTGGNDELVNPRLETGSLTPWSTLRTTSFGEFPGFGTVDPAAIAIDWSKQLAEGMPMVRCDGPADPTDGYQLFQDLSIGAPPLRDIHLRLTAWWLIPFGGGYAPNNLRFGILMTRHPVGAAFPLAYYTSIEDAQFALLDENAPRGRVFQQECELVIPAGTVKVVHIAACFPQGRSYVGGFSLRGDDGLDYVHWNPPGIAKDLVRHAQDPVFAKSDVNIAGAETHFGPESIDRSFVYEDHANVLSTINDLARDGWLDWTLGYTFEPAKSRTLTAWARRYGQYRRRARIRCDAAGKGNVAHIERSNDWNAGATVVAVQDVNGARHERALELDGGHVTLESVQTALRQPRDFELPAHARRQLLETAQPHEYTVTCNPGDERFLLGVRCGDTTDVESELPGALTSGRHRIVRRRVIPAADQVVLTLNPQVLS